MRRNSKGFTLVELIVVIIVIGVLAAIGTPTMTAMVARAKKSEAVTALGTIRTAERLYALEHSGNYAPVLYTEWATGGALNQYIGHGDLNGKYYNENAYSVVCILPNTFIARAKGGGSGGGAVNMDQDGSMTGN
ncbi:MAG: prepilin-type N-terminal cleavage/methylation domain-containing protein [Candidatus Omnitrophica bacterium]|nr:prepilin-type N-terminal cleavage/methylation domain-containing protein [Candidatus Omnitrophota bacterium]